MNAGTAFAALIHFFRAVAAETVLLLIEDIHWADRVTLDFLTYLLAHTTASSPELLLTIRGDHPRSDVDVERVGWRRPHTPTPSPLLLPPFSRGEVRDSSATRHPKISSHLVGELWSRAEGNAFFT